MIVLQLKFKVETEVLERHKVAAILLNGKEYANDLKEELKSLFLNIPNNNRPILGIIQVGNLEESNIYIKHKLNIAKDLGLETVFSKLPENSTFNQIKDEIVNVSKKVTGLIVQLPFSVNYALDPKDKQDILNLIPINKDIDGLSEYNCNSNYELNNNFLPATAKGIILLLDKYNINYKKTDISILGQSNIVGKPLAKYLSNFANKVRVFDKYDDKKDVINSNIVIVATGQKNPIVASNVKKNSIIIDVGIHRNNSKITGDLDFDSFYQKVKYLTPVPGGVGPMTVVSLIINLIKAYVLQNPHDRDKYKVFKKYIG